MIYKTKIKYERKKESKDNLENFDLEITESIKNIEFEGSGEIMIENYERNEDVKIVDRDKVCKEQQFSGDEATNNDYRNSNLASGPGQYDVHASSLVKDNYTKDFNDDLESVDNDIALVYVVDSQILFLPLSFIENYKKKYELEGCEL